MEPKNGGPGDSSTPKKKRAPSARKRAPKAVKSAGSTATEREEAPEAEVKPTQNQAAAEASRSGPDGRPASQRTSGERSVDLEQSDDGTFGDRAADQVADVAADLKAWMDTRREDRDTPREVL